MEISSINFVQNVLPQNKAQKSVNVTFKGGYDEKNIPSNEQCTIFFHPVLEFQKQLLADGYKMEDIKKHQIFDVIEIKDIDLSDPGLLDDALEGRITKDDIFSHSPKKLADIKALQRGYVLLKQKFNTPDVRKHLAWVGEIEDQMAKYFRENGIEAANKTDSKSMILSVLHYVDKNNVALLEELLDDENFNNVHLTTALMKLDKNKDMKYAHRVLHMAQEVGYDKEFGETLAILISEADLINTMVIKKMLGEQEFLIENEEFVENKLMSFLRGVNFNLLLEYVTNEAMTLKEVDELME